MAGGLEDVAVVPGVDGDPKRQAVFIENSSSPTQEPSSSGTGPDDEDGDVAVVSEHSEMGVCMLTPR